MHQRIRWSGALMAVLLVCLASVAVAACGSSSGSSSEDAAGLLKDTFEGNHKIDSGNINLALTINPTGSSSVSGPIKLSFGGPFQSGGSGKLPQSDFNVSISAEGKSGSLGIISTGSKGYITLQGTGYQLPADTFKKLQSSLSDLGASGSSSKNSTGLSNLGIKPLDWLQNPTVVGDETVAGDDTTHIRAGVNVQGLLTDLDTLLKKGSSLGVPKTANLSNGLSASTRAKLASEVRNTAFDVWTGKDDKMLRKLSIGTTLPVTGQTSTQLGGMTSAAIALTVQYSDLNQPQTITAPQTVRPYSEFSSKVDSLMQALQGATGATGSSSSGSGSSSGSSGSSNSGSGLAGASSSVKRYSKCVSDAGNDISKMQRCASLLNGG
jgi:hypothetical protein